MDKKTIHAQIVQEFECTVDSTVDLPTAVVSEMTLNAMSLLELKVKGIEQPLDYVYDGEKIHLVWQTPFSAKERRKVSFDYTVQNPVRNFHQL